MSFQVLFLICTIFCISFGQQPFTPSSTENGQNNQIKDYSCDISGYIEYLSNWSEEKKSSSRNPSSEEFTQRVQNFIDNCDKIHKWNRQDKYKLEFTYYADWSGEEFEKLGSTTQKYSGMKPDIYETQPFFNNTSYLDYSSSSLDPCDDVFEEGENSLRKTISQPQNCSVSWAFAITNSIEYAVKKMYKEEYHQDINIALSAQELIDCAGKDHGIENGCSGIPVAWGFDYVFENGIAFRQYYPHTNVYGECKVISNEHKYHIAGYEKPEVYNKYGLSELLKKGPVAVTLGLDPEYFQFYQNDRETGPYFNTAFWRPSVYGVLLESNQYKEDGLEEILEWPYFSVETRLRACDSMIFRLPILESVENANIGGIAGFAIRPIVSETVSQVTIVPTAKPSTQAPTTQLPNPCISASVLIISNESDCELLLENRWKAITVNEGLCNSMTSNLTLSNYPCLESIVIKKNSLKNLNHLVISNNLQLSSIVTEDGENWDDQLQSFKAALENVNSVEISSI